MPALKIIKNLYFTFVSKRQYYRKKQDFKTADVFLAMTVFILVDLPLFWGKNILHVVLATTVRLHAILC